MVPVSYLTCSCLICRAGKLRTTAVILDIGKRDLRVVAPLYGVESVLTLPSHTTIRVVPADGGDGHNVGAHATQPNGSHRNGGNGGGENGKHHAANAVAIIYHKLSNKALAAIRRSNAADSGISDAASPTPDRLVELMRVCVFSTVEVELTADVDTSPQVLYCTLVLPAPAHVQRSAHSNSA